MVSASCEMQRTASLNPYPLLFVGLCPKRHEIMARNRTRRPSKARMRCGSDELNIMLSPVSSVKVLPAICISMRPSTT